MSSATAMHSDTVRVLSSVFIIAQSDTREIKYLISWLQKKVWDCYFLRKLTFSEPLEFKGIYFFEKSLVPFLTFLNSEGPYLAEGSHHNLCPCFDIVFVQLGDIPRTRSMFAEIVAAAEHYLIITHVKIKQPYRICHLVESAVEIMSTKKGKKSYLIYNNVILGKMTGKAEPLS